MIIVSSMFMLCTFSTASVVNNPAQIGTLTEITSLRTPNTRVWQTQSVKDDIDMATRIVSQVTVTRNIFEKCDGVCYDTNLGTARVPNYQLTVEQFNPGVLGIAYVANQGNYQVFLPTNITNSNMPISYQTKNYTLPMGFRGLGYTMAGSTSYAMLGSVSSVTATQTGTNSITYPNVYPGIDLQFLYQKGSFHTNVIVNSQGSLPSPSLYGYDPNTAQLLILVELGLDSFGGTLANNSVLQNSGTLTDGSFTFSDPSTNAHLCSFDPAVVITSDTTGHNTHQPISQMIVKQGTHYYLYATVPYSYLQTASYPVTLDPPVIRSGSQDDNEVWKSGITYYLSGTWTVSNGDTLVIEGGAIIKMKTDGITVASGGKILAQGTTFNYILFTSANDTMSGDTTPGTTGNPASGDYYYGINLASGSSSNSRIEYCKFAYAYIAVNVSYVNLTNPIQNNIIRVCNYGAYLNGYSGTNVTLKNNLFALCSNEAIIASATDNNRFATALNITIDNSTVAIYSGNNAFTACKNNLITNCWIGLTTNGVGFGSHSYTKFYGVNNNWTNTSPDYTTEGNVSNPYVISPNGSYYLDQSNDSVNNAGDSTAYFYGLNTKTTVAPAVAPNTITSSTTWSKIQRDTGIVDIGYHYDPVDVVVGNSGSYSALTIGTSGVDSATLTILPGVVVSFWRNATTTNAEIFSWAYPNIIAHGYANDRIEFTSIYATGSLHTHPLGADGLYSYFIGIHIGQNLGPNSIIQNCIFRYAKAGIDLDQGTVLYHRISDNVFYDCRNGIDALDSYVRAENNLFLAGNNNQYQILADNISYSNNSAIIRNNTLVGNGSGWYGIIGVTDTTFSNYVDIRNNIAYGFATGIFFAHSYYTGIVAYNSLYNNTLNYSGDPTNSNSITVNPQFANSGSGSFDGYYLASITGDVSRYPFTNYDLAGINQGTIPSKTGSSIVVYASTDASTGVQLGYLSGGSYTDESTNQGNILVQLLNSSGAGWSLSTSQYFTLYFLSGATINVYVPTVSISIPNSLYLWVALDGSSYYANSNHGIGALNQDAWYAMNYDPTGLAQNSFSYLSTSPLVHAGDTTVRFYGSTATNQTLDSGTVNIGYHYLNRGFVQVAENQRQFEYEDGTPFVANGSSLGFASFEYQDAASLPNLDNYFALIRSHGVTAITETLHQDRSSPYKYTNDTISAWCIEQPIGTYHDETAQWWDHYLNLLDKNDIKLGWLVWQGQDGFGYDTTTYGTFGNATTPPAPRDDYNPFNKNSPIFMGTATTDLDVYQSANTLAYETSLMTYCINRWGDHESILYWDPIQESDYVVDQNSLSSDSLNFWINTLHGFIKDYQVQKWGHSHMLVASSGRPFASYNTLTSTVVLSCSGSPPPTSMPPRAGPYAFGGDYNAILIKCVTECIQTCLFTNPVLDMYNVHYGGFKPLTFPAVDAITAQAPGGLWYPVLGQQWLIDSVATDMVLQTHFIVTSGFSIMTGSKRPYFAGLYYPGFWEVPWIAETSWWHLDPPSSYDPGTTIYAPAYSTISIDRHIDPTFKQAYHHYNGWALTASGAAGAGFGGGVPEFNQFNTDTNGTFSLNGGHVFYQLGTTEYRNKISYNHEYNPFNYSILTDYLAYYKIQTTVNWNTLTWENLDSTNRISLSGFTDVYPFYSGDSSNMLVYFLRDMLNTQHYDTTTTTGTPDYYSTNSVTNMSVAFSGFPTYTSITVMWFDPATGNSLGSSTFSTGSTTITAPGFNREIVAVLKPQ